MKFKPQNEIHKNCVYVVDRDTKFFLKIVDAQLLFEKNATGKIETAYLMQNGNTIPAKRVNQ